MIRETESDLGGTQFRVKPMYNHVGMLVHQSMVLPVLQFVFVLAVFLESTKWLMVDSPNQSLN